MQFDFRALTAAERYKILIGTVVPRPIAWVTTLSRDGARNAAPYSFFNAMSKDPPLVALGVQANGRGGMKDTGRNILDTGEFVVNLVPHALVEPMSFTSYEAPSEVDELEAADIKTTASVLVQPPRIALSPVAFECRLHTHLEVSPNHLIVLGEVVYAHVADEAMLDPAKLYIDTPKLDLIGRMHGRGWYAGTHDLFQIERPPEAAPPLDGTTPR